MSNENRYRLTYQPILIHPDGTPVKERELFKATYSWDNNREVEVRYVKPNQYLSDDDGLRFDFQEASYPYFKRSYRAEEFGLRSYRKPSREITPWRSSALGHTSRNQRIRVPRSRRLYETSYVLS